MRNLGGGEFKGRPPCIYRCQVPLYSDSEDLGILREALQECKTRSMKKVAKGRRES